MRVGEAAGSSIGPWVLCVEEQEEQEEQLVQEKQVEQVEQEE